LYLGFAGGALIGAITLATYIGILALLRAPELAAVAPLMRRLRRR
jgi:hypothetical protein